MGNSDSRLNFEFGSIYLQLDKPQYCCGEVINGTAHIYLQSDYPSQLVVLHIIGKEKTYWETGKNGENKHVGRKYICNLRQVLYQFPSENMPPGQYSFPFSFQIPDWLPVSFQYYGALSSKFSIKYKMEVKIESSRPKEEQKYKPFIGKRRLIIRKNIQSLGMPMTTSYQQPIDTFFWVKQGTSKADVTFERDSYNPKDIAKVHVVIDNSNCKKNLMNVTLRLRRFLVCKDSTNDKFKENIILVEQDLEGVKKRSTGELHMEINLSSITKLNGFQKSALKKKEKKGKNLEELKTLEELMTPSTMGTLIQCNYFLEVDFIHKGATWQSGLPKAVRPVIIYPNSVSEMKIQVPNDWNPQVFQAQVIMGMPQNQEYHEPIPLGVPDFYGEEDFKRFSEYTKGGSIVQASPVDENIEKPPKQID